MHAKIDRVLKQLKCGSLAVVSSELKTEQFNIQFGIVNDSSKRQQLVIKCFVLCFSVPVSLLVKVQEQPRPQPQSTKTTLSSGCELNAWDFEEVSDNFPNFNRVLSFLIVSAQFQVAGQIVSK